MKGEKLMEYSKRTKQADMIMSFISVVGLLYTIFCVIVLTLDTMSEYNIKADFNYFLLPIDTINNFLPIIIGSLLIACYDIYINTGSEGKIDERPQEIINAENTHQTLIKAMTLFCSALISLVINIYKENPRIILIVILLCFLTLLITLLKNFKRNKSKNTKEDKENNEKADKRNPSVQNKDDNVD